MGFSAFFADTINSSCPAVTSESMFCNDTCKDDFYCQSFEKCCSTGCGRTCQNSTGLRFVTRTQKTHLRHAFAKIRNVINKSILVKQRRFFEHACKKTYIQTFCWKNYGLKNYDFNNTFLFLCNKADKDLVFDRQMIYVLETLWIYE